MAESERFNIAVRESPHLLQRFSEKQLSFLLVACSESKYGESISLELFANPQLQDRTPHVIYFYRSENNHRYVGQAVKGWTQRDSGHRSKGKLQTELQKLTPLFDVQYHKTRQEGIKWQHVILCNADCQRDYANSGFTEADLLEVILIILLGSNKYHSKTGLNTLFGGYNFKTRQATV